MNEAQARPEMKKSGLQMVMIEAPIVPLEQGKYVTRHIDVQLSPRQAQAARRLLDGLDSLHARLSNGRHVQSVGDVVRYLLEQAARAAEGG